LRELLGRHNIKVKQVHCETTGRRCGGWIKTRRTLLAREQIAVD
jgi:hypothetical protein